MKLPYVFTENLAPPVTIMHAIPNTLTHLVGTLPSQAMCLDRDGQYVTKQCKFLLVLRLSKTFTSNFR